MAKLPTRISELPAVKLAYLANQLRAKKDLLAAEPIAVVGMSCRFPGGGELPETFWQFLREGGDATREVPPERWNIDEIYDPTPGAKGKVYTRRGAFIENVDLFEPAFFGIPPRDAKDMDPQQRMLLEECWRSLERAGIPPAGLTGSRTGVFVGLMHNDYNVLGITAGVEMHSASLNYPSMAAGRIAHTLGLQGPALTVDTACSSSAVAVHLACQSLRNDESDLALAGGVSLSLSPITMMFECQNRMLAVDGRCKTFDASADGFSRGEGCGVVVLKRLSDALAQGNPILGVIRGSALNHDGRSSGLMVPNGRAQERVIRMALEGCGVEPEQVSYVEAHGTGTSLGDPIEMEALRSVFGRAPARATPLYVGSVKTNIGHLEAAAGIAGLIKVLLSLRHEAIPAHLHFSRPNPNIRWDDLPVVIPTALQPWPRGEQRRIAGLSSFGFSGTNVHLVVEEAPLLPRPLVARERPVHLLTLSAKTEAALEALVEVHASTLPDEGEVLGDWCYTANVGRSHFEHRAAVSGENAAELRAGLSRLRAGRPRPLREPRRGTESPRPVFLFTGQGSLRPGVGRELAGTWPVFRAAVQRCSGALEGLLEPRLEDLLYGEQSSSLLADTRHAQPALVALEYALSELWASWGIVPGAVVGHSLGEYAAAVVAGVLSIEDALKLVVARSRLIHEAPGEGGMLAVNATLEVLTPTLAPVSQFISLAAVNGPQDLVISGDRAALSELAARLSREGIACRPLSVTHAFHSPLMDPVVAAFEACFDGVALEAPRLPFVSTLEGELVAEALTRPAYWCRHLREPVRFAEALEALREQKHRTFLEVGPTPVLTGLGLRSYPEEEALSWLPSLRPATGETAQLLTALGALYERGFEVDWNAFDAPFERRSVTLPTYPFRRERYWIDSPTGGSMAERRTARASAPLLAGAPLSLAGTKGARFETRLSTREPSFLAEHRVFGATVLPAACYVEMALGAAHFMGPSEASFDVLSFELERPLVLGEGEGREVQTVLTPEEGRTHFEIYSQEATEADRHWARLAHGYLVAHRESARHVELEAGLLARFSAPRPVEPFYALMARHGIEYGPSFRAIDALRFGKDACLAHVRLPDNQVVGMGEYRLHPLILDACFQTVAALFMDEASEARDHRQRMPVAIQRLRWFKKPGSSAWVHARRDERASASDELLSIDLRILGETGEVIAEVEGLLLKRIDRRALSTSFADSSRELLLELAWRELEAPRARTPASLQSQRWLLLADSSGVAEGLKAQVQRRGGTCVWVTPDASDEPGHVHVDPNQPEGFVRLLQSLSEEGAAPTTVVCLWGLDEPGAEALSAESTRSATGVLHLVQAMARASWAQRPALWLVTRGAVAATPGDTVDGLAQSMLWGLGRAAALEHPELGCRLVDLDEGEDAPARLFERMTRATGENLLALRGSRLLGARLTRPISPSNSANPVGVHADGAYLITGGLGALGLATAAWLVDAGARHLVLVGRGAPGEATKLRLDELGARGCEVTVARADVSRLDDVRRVLEEVSASGTRLRGIFHVAGVLEDGVFLRQDRERLARVLAPKVMGAWNLHHATAGLPLDLFVMYSSAASLVGVAGQANYMAANTFLDALAHHRRAKGLPALSVNWGQWAGGGMAQKARGRTATSDATSLPPQRALRILEELLGRELTQVGVLPVDASTQGASLSEVHGPLFSELVVRGKEPSAGTGRMVELLEEFTRSDGARRRGLLTHYVRGRLAPLLGFPPEHEALQKKISLNELGLDSLRAVELKNRMGRELGVDLPMARFIDGTGVAGIVEALHEQLELSELLARVPVSAAQSEVEELTL
ncbi:Acyl transferase domain-containing protein [Myxococcus fulvus]|uniref:Acyl transferase domain-containing protein n=1 Tax=Myxococcus fulvus TaxID=33 RepID=A0A511T8W8_MYXFU|nr:type I polyketide synthase [Myxococcus fulvus]GEN10599.1 polyketide synthase [Myxococcus fulvus]SET78979.1 Acyl transferase domain-containing protein [Myxococcus fulvus]